MWALPDSSRFFFFFPPGLFPGGGDAAGLIAEACTQWLRSAQWSGWPSKVPSNALQGTNPGQSPALGKRCSLDVASQAPAVAAAIPAVSWPARPWPIQEVRPQALGPWATHPTNRSRKQP